MVTGHPRSANACESCRRRKVKCSGEHPCGACVKHSWECVFGRPDRKRYSEAQVKRLLNKIQSYEEQLAARNPGEETSIQGSSLHNSPVPNSSSINFSRQPQESQHSSRRASVGAGLTQSLDCSDGAAGISPATDLTSGPAFESQVRSLLTMSNQRTPRHAERERHTSTDDQLGSLETLADNADGPSIPSLEASQHLLDKFLFYLGVSQHFFDSRSFSDSMILLFQSPAARETQKRTQWYTEYLLVMAMAKLMDVEQPTSQPPGSDLFAEAIKRLPPLHQLTREGVLAVEILTLITTYLQWCDRKLDAYLHIGLAIRLSIALGCNLPEHEQNCLPSQSTHRLRLWWTVYMLDRRLSSGMGLAAGADERQLRAGFPKHAVGFQSPVAMIINIRIARVTDDIMSSLYGNTTITQIELVRKVQDIIQELHDIGRSFPQSLLLDFSRPLQTVSRTGSSLYLMLLQAIILCTRPMLLHKVRVAAQGQQPPRPPESAPDSLARLCETCNEAATRSLAILYALRLQQIIPRYGFFDLDSTFSAAFVLVMVGFTSPSQKNPPTALTQAFEVLRFLSRSGNLAAEQRFQDIAQSCSHVWPDYTFDIDASDKPAGETDGSAPERAGEGEGGDSGLPSHQPGPPPHYMSIGGQPFHQDESRLFEPWNYSAPSDGAFDMQGELDIDFAEEAEGIYSSFHHPTLPLTGVDYMDWLEIEKLLNTPVG